MRLAVAPNHVTTMTLCTEILEILNNIQGVHVMREDIAYNDVERLAVRVGSRLIRLTLITADVCTCHAEIGATRYMFRTAHEFALFMQNHGARECNESDSESTTDESD